jgi:hypothetical protein
MTKQISALVLALLTGPAFSAGATLTYEGMTLKAWDYSGWAVCSLTHNGFEYIDGFDHGRCLQSAVSFDNLGEGFNPTEAGNYADGLLPNPSTSLLFAFVEGGDRMATEVEMAFWQGGRSRHVLRKWLYAGLLGKNIVEHRIAFEIPEGEIHSTGQFEVLTGYMPAAFSRFRTFDPATGIETALSDGPGEQALPVIFCTPDDARCMGVYSPLPLVGGGYGRWRFIGNQCMTKAGATGCVKWNMVVRYPNPRGTYRFHVLSTVGTLAEVKSNMMQMRKAFQ